ncbi:hypothetical protein ACLOJK_018838 [Asimina triloba]
MIRLSRIHTRSSESARTLLGIDERHYGDTLRRLEIELRPLKATPQGVPPQLAMPPIPLEVALLPTEPPRTLKAVLPIVTLRERPVCVAKMHLPPPLGQSLEGPPLKEKRASDTTMEDIYGDVATRRLVPSSLSDSPFIDKQKILPRRKPAKDSALKASSPTTGAETNSDKISSHWSGTTQLSFSYRSQVWGIIDQLHIALPRKGHVAWERLTD